MLLSFVRCEKQMRGQKQKIRIRPDSSVGRAKDWKSLCRWFDSGSGHLPNHRMVGMELCRCGSMVEHQPSKLNTWVRFPSPALDRKIENARVAQLVEHDLAKVGVAGSSPVSRSSELVQKYRKIGTSEFFYASFCVHNASTAIFDSFWAFGSLCSNPAPLSWERRSEASATSFI